LTPISHVREKNFMINHVNDTIENLTGFSIQQKCALGGGCVSDVYKVGLSNGETVVAKVGDTGSGLALEGMMLGYLSQHSELPVPDVLYADDTLLLMTWVPSAGTLDSTAQIHAADLVASLHQISDNYFGFSCDTVIGGLNQANPQCESWLDFFAQHRLLEMARQGLDSGRLPTSLMGRLEKFSDNLNKWLKEPEQPSLIHGDMWGGNVLADVGRISGFVDPAIYFADAEIELAFTTLFSTFGDVFFSRYREHREIQPGFFEERRDLYNLYPLLVHVRLFGGSYVGSVDSTLKKFGF
jgi:fructosamine-3-kinase